MGISTSARRASSSVAAALPTPSATMRVEPRISLSSRPLPSSMPTERLRLSAPVAVSIRSPTPARPARFRGARRARRPVASSPQARASPARPSVLVPSPRPSDSRRDRDYIFHRAGDFRADHVIVGVEPKSWTGKFLLNFGREPGVRRRENHRCGISGGNFDGKAWTGEHGDARR